MSVHLWRKTGNARRVLVLLVLFAGLTAGVSIASVAQQQGAGGSPAAQTGKLEAFPAETAGTQAPADSSQAQAPLAADSTTPKAGTPEAACPPEYLPLVQKTTTALLRSDFTFYPVKALDPFVPFIQPEAPPVRLPEEGDEQSAESDKPLTPLQKMTIAEIERGLRAITWGALGKKAVIEDATRKGFIVGVGTPVGERNGVIMQIQKDRLVIQQQVWDRMARKRLPQEVIVKLAKQTKDQVSEDQLSVGQPVAVQPGADQPSQ